MDDTNPTSGASMKAVIIDGLALVFRLGLAGVFVYSAWHKIEDPISFAIKVHEYDILPAGWADPFARVLPRAMAVGAALLVPGLLTRLGALMHGSMLIMFLTAIGVNIYRDRVLGCGCFSEEGSAIGWGLMVLDTGLLAAAVFLVVVGGGRLSVDRLLWRLWKGRGGGVSSGEKSATAGPED